MLNIVGLQKGEKNLSFIFVRFWKILFNPIQIFHKNITTELFTVDHINIVNLVFTIIEVYRKFVWVNKNFEIEGITQNDENKKITEKKEDRRR